MVTQIKAAHEALKGTFGAPVAPAHDGRIPAGTAQDAVTAVAADKLRELNEQLLRTPDWFTPHPKLMKQLDYGKGYQYAHDDPEGTADMDCLPESLAGKKYYKPTERGFEKEIKRRIEGWA